MKISAFTRRLISASCLSLLIAWQAFATEPIQQPTLAGVDQMAVVATEDAAVTPAGCCESGCDNSGCKSGCCGKSCCEAVCCPKKVTEEVKKHCWKVESKMVCIPGYRFECNWRKNKCCKGGCDSCCDSCCSSGGCNDCGTPTCGRVRCINVLEKHEYTCEECGYEWDVKCVRKGNRRCKSGCCNCPSCGASGCCASAVDIEADVQLTSGTEALPVEATETGKTSLVQRLMGMMK